MPYIKYNPILKERARKLRKNSTPSEICLWKELRGNNLGNTLNRQKPLDQFIVDFYCKELGLVIEIDGDSHDDKRDYDSRRQNRLEALGLTVIRFYDHDVMKHTEGVVSKIKRVMDELEKQDSKAL